jgi:dihydroorotase
MTVGLQGEQMTQIGELKAAGAVAVTDDGKCVQNNELMRRVVQYAKHFKLPVLDHCEDYDLASEGVMNEGYWSTVLGLPGISPLAEDMIVARDILLAKSCDWDLHIQHISTAGAVEMVRQARRAGIRVSAEATPHHIALRDEDIDQYDSNFKMNPPLRTDQDRIALIEGILDGTITVLATDHAPHMPHEKQVEFGCAPFGILGLETAVPIYLNILYHMNKMELSAIVKAMTQAPADLLKLEVGTLQPGRLGDVTILDLDRRVEIDPELSLSKSRNTPFGVWRLQGDAVATIVGGKIVMNRMEGHPQIIPGQ